MTEARQNLKELLDAAEAGIPNTVRRERLRATVVDADRLRHFLASMRPAKAQLVSEAGGWSAKLPGLSIAADGETLDEAVDETVVVLREYAADWVDHLRHVSNHRDNWALVQIIDLSTDEQLAQWLRAESEGSLH